MHHTRKPSRSALDIRERGRSWHLDSRHDPILAPERSRVIAAARERSLVVVVRVRVLIAVLGVACATVTIAACGRSGGTAHARSSAARSRTFVDVPAVPRSGSFVSLWLKPRMRYPVIELFSLRSGRPLGRLADTPMESTGPPHPTQNGELWLTSTTGPKCRYPLSIDCGPPVPDSCSSTIRSIDPATGSEQVIASFPRSMLVSDAIPSGTGQLAVLMTGGCSNAYFNEHFVVEDLASGRSWAIGADARPCHGLSAPAFNAGGSRLVFTYAPSALRPGEPRPGPGAAGEVCLAPKASGIVVVAADQPSSARSWKLIAPRSGCQYTSAAFDDSGIAAFQTCAPGRRGPPSNDFLGPDAFVQLDAGGRVLYRVPLELGANPGVVLSDPVTGEVLITQDQTYRQHRPTHEFVWQLHGRRLRLIATYPFSGSGLLAAQPW
jgi:hypothetical protein